MMELNLYQWSYEVVTWFSLSGILSVLGLYVRHLRVQERESNMHLNTEIAVGEYMSCYERCCARIPWMSICTIGCFFGYFLTNLLASLEIWFGVQFCFARIQLFIIVYGLGHWGLGSVLLLRLELIFKHSAYGYSSRCITGLQLLLGVTTIGVIVSSPFHVEGISTTLSQCTFQAPKWFMLFALLTNVVINFGSLALFLKPLFRVLATSLDDRLRYVAIKCTVLTTISTISAILGIIGAGLQWFHICRINDVVQCTCLLLMNNTYKNWYEWMCAGCIVCCKSPVYMIEKTIVVERVVATLDSTNRPSNSNNSNNHSNNTQSPTPP